MGDPAEHASHALPGPIEAWRRFRIGDLRGPTSSPQAQRRRDPSPPTAPRTRPLRSRRLDRQLEAREVDEEEKDSRSGPFFVPFGDPPQTIQDPAGLRRPEDRDEDIDLEALAEELERLGRLPRVRSSARVHEVLESESERARSATESTNAAASDALGLRYPEWDYRTHRYRRAYCAFVRSPQLRASHRGACVCSRSIARCWQGCGDASSGCGRGASGGRASATATRSISTRSSKTSRTARRAGRRANASTSPSVRYGAT